MGSEDFREYICIDLKDMYKVYIHQRQANPNPQEACRLSYNS